MIYLIEHNLKLPCVVIHNRIERRREEKTTQFLNEVLHFLLGLIVCTGIFTEEQEAKDPITTWTCFSKRQHQLLSIYLCSIEISLIPRECWKSILCSTLYSLLSIFFFSSILYIVNIQTVFRRVWCL